ncbi:hypothetical protein [uncultured Jannaschia sp.]|uniref:hypothetical protein n=1 Tax=uncultured Jannaschia sp. TaxID=293347 RepID=UPI00262C2401|nr:hypothetical protein [uncultured Jannaschia sp.]
MSGPIPSDAASPGAGIASSDASGSGPAGAASATATPAAGGADDLQLGPVVTALVDHCTANPDTTMAEAVRSARTAGGN